LRHFRKIKNAYTILIKNLKGRHHFGQTSTEDNIKIDLTEVGYEVLVIV
jgi:hypothetical protein